MSDLPLVSVIIPCLNRADFLEPTIESILQQDYPNIECIVVDGGSTDATLEILNRYRYKIKWVSEPDNGHADAINKGWQMSKGEILAWLNADDVWAMPEAVSQVIAYWQTHSDANVVYGDCGVIDVRGNFIGMSYLHEWDLVHAVEYCDHCIPQPAAFIHRRVLERVGWLDTSFYQKKDHELWLRVGLVGGIHYVPILLAHARQVEGLSQDGRTAAPACVQVTKKFYTLPDLPSHFYSRKQRAFSNSYLRGMDYAFAGGRHWSIIFNYTLKAILADPTNTFNVFHQFRQHIRVGVTEDRRLLPILVGLKLLVWPFQLLRKIKKTIRGEDRISIPNLLGDRDIEWSWVAAQMPSGPGKALDFGNGGSLLALMAAQRGFDVTAIDLGAIEWPYVYPDLRFIRGDILKLPLPTQDFDLIINCSTVEHVGLVGRYGVAESRPDEDLMAMVRLGELMKPGGMMLLTIPVGRDTVFDPLCRIYGVERLPRLLAGYVIEKEIFWVKDSQNRWMISDKETALNFEASAGSWNALQNVYALGCFVLRKGAEYSA